MMQDSGSDDLRVFERFPAKIPLKFLNLDSNTEGQALTEDVSAKGIGFTTSEMLNPNSTLEMWLQVPDQGEPLYTRGEVVWTKTIDGNRFRYGVNLQRADFMGISRILRSI